MKFDIEARPFLLRAAFLIFCVFMVYSSVLPADFRTLDDSTLIVNNELLRDWQNFPLLFQQSFFGKGTCYRPLVSLNYMLDWHLFGAIPLFYYLENILIHAINAIIVMLLMTRITRNASTGWWTAVLFAVHPIQWEAVTNISGRSILLCAMFGLLSFLYLVRSRQGENGGFRAVFFFILALLCKESAVMLPVVVWSYLLLVEPYDKRPLRRVYLKLEAFALVIFAYFVLRHALNITTFSMWGNLKLHVLGVLTFIKGLFIYAGLFVFPTDLHFDRSLPLFNSLSSPAAWGAAAALIVLLGAFVRYHRRMPTSVAFCMVWPLLELVPVSQVITSVGTMPGHIALNEHFLYLPAIGVCALLVMGVQRLEALNQKNGVLSKTIFQAMTGGGLVLFAGVTVIQSIYASRETVMYKRSLSFEPRNSRLRNALARNYADQRKFIEAEAEYRVVLTGDPDNMNAWTGMVQSICDQGRFDECVGLYEGLAQKYPEDKLIRANLASTYRVLFNKLKRQVRETPLDPALHAQVGKIYAYLRYTKAAIGAYENALKIDGEYQPARYALGEIYESKGLWENALAQYIRSVSGQKDLSISARAEDGIRRIYGKLGRPEIADQVIRELNKR